jgi:hypothetical protein
MTSTMRFDKWENSLGQPYGAVLQVVYATSGFVNQTINSATPVALTGLSATITPKFANSMILIEGVVAASWSYVSGVYIFKNGTSLIPAHGSNSQSGGTNVLWTTFNRPADVDSTIHGASVFPFSILYRDLPNSTSAITYDFRANSGYNGGANPYYLNNRSFGDMLSSSYIKITEIAQ